MYRPNQIVEYRERYGRVIYHDPITHFVHVLFRLNNTTWKIEKCDDLHCKPAQVFLWTIESAFCIRHRMRVNTPYLAPVRNVLVDHIMEL